MKSILQSERNICFLCAYLKGDTHEQFTHCHHAIAGTANRKLSERYGLKYYLCPAHHEFGPEAVHRNKDINLLLMKAAELVFIKRHSYEKWMQVFQKNFLEPEEMMTGGCHTAIGAVCRLESPPRQWEEGRGFELIADPIKEELPL